VERVVVALKPLSVEKEQQLGIDLPPNLPEVLADADRIGQVLTNLIGNAIKFTPQGGDILVRAAAADESGFVQFSVADTGPGVSTNDRERIFAKYQQVEDRWTYGIKGTGLGLPIARQIIEAHGGGIWVETKEEKGSIFSFTLPTAPNARGDAAAIR
jgi:signal transduction histidine kinase